MHPRQLVGTRSQAPDRQPLLRTFRPVAGQEETRRDGAAGRILLCTDKNHALAEYALAGMDNHLFVSKYLLELPQKEEMQRFIDEQLREVGE